MRRKLYRIRRKDTGKYFLSGSYYPSNMRGPHWGKTGVYFQMEATIIKHLNNLCSDIRFYPAGHVTYKSVIVNHGIVSGRIDLFEVEVSDATIHSTTTIDAVNIIENKTKEPKQCVK